MPRPPRMLLLGAGSAVLLALALAELWKRN